MDHQELRQIALRTLKRSPENYWSMEHIEAQIAADLAQKGKLAPNHMNRLVLPVPDRELVRDVIWDLLSRGILYPSRNPTYANQELRVDEFRVSAKGRRYLDDQVYDLNDTTGYIASLQNALVFQPETNETILAYAAEGIRAFEGSMPLACVVMTGCAAEAAILDVITAFEASSLVTPSDRQSYAKKAASSIKAKFDWFRETFSAKQIADRDVADWMEHVTGGAGILMSTRNAGGHPERANPTLDDARANLVLFQSVLPRLGKLCRYLCEQAS